MKNLKFVVAVAVVFTFMAAGCQIAGPMMTATGDKGLTAYGGGAFSANQIESAARAHATIADANARYNRSSIESQIWGETQRTEAAIREATVKRIAEGDPHLASLIGEFKDLLGEYAGTEDAAEKERILIALRTTGMAIQSLVPGAYGYGGETYGQVGYGGNVGMPMSMPTGGGFVPPAATNQTGFGAVWNRSSRWTIRGFMNGQFVGDAGPGQPIPCMAVPDGLNPLRVEAYDHGLLVGVYEATVSPNPRNPSHRKPYRWTEEVGDNDFRRPE